MNLHFSIVVKKAFSLRNFDGGILHKTLSHGKGVDLRVPLIMRRVLLSWTSILLQCELPSQDGELYLAVGYTIERADCLKQFAFAPQKVPAKLYSKLFMYLLYVNDLSSLTPKYLGF